jgi:hypothetical protein
MQWENATFHFDSARQTDPCVSEDQVRQMLAEFRPQLINLATPIWRTQANGLQSALFLR